jgi:parvulin-like peptidyl-prolyl isomerase
MKKIFGLLTSFAFWACSLSAAPVIVDGIYLIVNQQIFTFSEAEEARNALRQQLLKENQTSDEAEIAKRVEARLIAELLLRSRAKALRIDASADEVQERIGLLREQNPQLRTVNDKILQNQIADDFRRQRLLAREVDVKVRVEDEEITELCNVQTMELRQIELAQILLRGEEIPERIQIIREQFSKGMAFEEMAKALSDDPAAKKNGGRLGQFRKGELFPAIEKVAFQLEVGQLSDPLKTEFGTHLLLVKSENLPDKIQCDALSEVQRKQFQEKVFQKVRQQSIKDYIAELRKKAQITVSPFPKEWND